MSKIQAIILAGGRGSRLKPYTSILPKPLVPIGEYPIAEIIIRQLKNLKITNILMSTGHMAELIESYFGSGRKWGVNIKYVKERRNLGTAGALKLVKNSQDDFLVINGDILTNLNYLNLLKYHRKNNNMATIVIKKRIVKTDFGVILFDKDKNMTNYIEKPEHNSFVSIGVNVINKKCIKYIKKDEDIGMPELMIRLMQAKQKVKCNAIKSDWLDLGRIEDLESAHMLWEKNKRKFLKKI